MRDRVWIAVYAGVFVQLALERRSTEGGLSAEGVFDAVHAAASRLADEASRRVGGPHEARSEGKRTATEPRQPTDKKGSSASAGAVLDDEEAPVDDEDLEEDEEEDTED